MRYTKHNPILIAIVALSLIGGGACCAQITFEENVTYGHGSQRPVGLLRSTLEAESFQGLIGHEICQSPKQERTS